MPNELDARALETAAEALVVNINNRYLNRGGIPNVQPTYDKLSADQRAVLLSDARAVVAAYLDAALPEREGLVETRWTEADREAMAREICLFRGERPWQADSGGVEKWEEYCALADAVLKEASRLSALSHPAAQSAEAVPVAWRAAYELAVEWSKADTMQLRGGEMTAQEIRTVRAMMLGLAAEFKSRMRDFTPLLPAEVESEVRC